MSTLACIKIWKKNYQKVYYKVTDISHTPTLPHLTLLYIFSFTFNIWYWLCLVYFQYFKKYIHIRLVHLKKISLLFTLTQFMFTLFTLHEKKVIATLCLFKINIEVDNLTLSKHTERNLNEWHQITAYIQDNSKGLLPPPSLFFLSSFF